jgi:tripeptidyl-peptidase I
LTFDAPASDAERLFATEYHVFEHTKVGTTATACDEYHLPKHIQKHVDYVSPGIKLLAPRKAPRNVKRDFHRSSDKKFIEAPEMPLLVKQAAGNLSTCDIAITPQCVQALYKFPNGTKADPRNALGVFEDLGDIYAQEDLDLFYANFTPYIPKGWGPKLEGIDGGLAPTTLSNAGGESDLDFELAIPIIYPQKTIVFQTDDLVYENDYEFGGFFNTFLDALDASYCTYAAFGEKGDDPLLDPFYPDPAPGGFKNKTQCGVYKPTNVISISYGGQESDLPAYYQQRQCNEWLKLGLQGTSVFVASGDDGVGGPAGDDSANGCLGNGTVFSPAFPNSCPW